MKQGAPRETCEHTARTITHSRCRRWRIVSVIMCPCFMCMWVGTSIFGNAKIYEPISCEGLRCTSTAPTPRRSARYRCEMHPRHRFLPSRLSSSAVSARKSPSPSPCHQTWCLSDATVCSAESSRPRRLQFTSRSRALPRCCSCRQRAVGRSPTRVLAMVAAALHFPASSAAVAGACWVPEWPAVPAAPFCSRSAVSRMTQCLPLSLYTGKSAFEPSPPSKRPPGGRRGRRDVGQRRPLACCAAAAHAARAASRRRAATNFRYTARILESRTSLLACCH